MSNNKTIFGADLIRKGGYWMLNLSVPRWMLNELDSERERGCVWSRGGAWIEGGSDHHAPAGYSLILAPKIVPNPNLVAALLDHMNAVEKLPTFAAAIEGVEAATLGMVVFTNRDLIIAALEAYQGGGREHVGNEDNGNPPQGGGNTNPADLEVHQS